MMQPLQYLFCTGLAFVALQTALPTDPMLHLVSSLGLGGVMFYFYRRDVVNTRDNYETIIKDVTAALTKLTTIIERKN